MQNKYILSTGIHDTNFFRIVSGAATVREYSLHTARILQRQDLARAANPFSTASTGIKATIGSITLRNPPR